MSDSYFQLNLLQWRENRRYQCFLCTIYILLFSLMSSILLALGFNVYFSRSHDGLTRSISLLQIEKLALDKELLRRSRLMQDIQHYQNLNAQYAKQKEQNLQQLNSLSEIASAIPESSSLTQLSFQANQWRLVGKSENATEVEVFIAGLRETQMFQQISLERLERVAHQPNSAEDSSQFLYALVQSKANEK